MLQFHLTNSNWRKIAERATHSTKRNDIYVCMYGLISQRVMEIFDPSLEITEVYEIHKDWCIKVMIIPFSIEK